MFNHGPDNGVFHLWKRLADDASLAMLSAPLGYCMTEMDARMLGIMELGIHEWEMISYFVMMLIFETFFFWNNPYICDT